MKIITMIMLAGITTGCPSAARRICDRDKQERIIMECLDRTTSKVISAGEDVDLGSAVRSCKFMAEELSCWYEEQK
jgi:hypothetical protein